MLSTVTSFGSTMVQQHVVVFPSLLDLELHINLTPELPGIDIVSLKNLASEQKKYINTKTFFPMVTES